ncbi:MAG: response regulator [Elusimicrobiota bacterium]
MPRKILIADDDPAMLRVYAGLFSGRDYELTYADSVAAAAALIGKNHYDLLVTDLMFPDGLGTELTRLFAERSAGAKSLLVTGSPPEPGALAAYAVLECLPKPLEPEKFIKTVAKALA